MGGYSCSKRSLADLFHIWSARTCRDSLLKCMQYGCVSFFYVVTGVRLFTFLNTHFQTKATAVSTAQVLPMAGIARAAASSARRARYDLCQMKTRTHPTCVLAPHHQSTIPPRAMERQTEHAVSPSSMMVYGPDRWRSRSRE